MYEGEIDPRYHAYYQKAHEERAAAFRDAMGWVIRLGRASSSRR